MATLDALCGALQLLNALEDVGVYGLSFEQADAIFTAKADFCGKAVRLIDTASEFCSASLLPEYVPANCFSVSKRVWLCDDDAQMAQRRAVCSQDLAHKAHPVAGASDAHGSAHYAAILACIALRLNCRYNAGGRGLYGLLSPWWTPNSRLLSLQAPTEAQICLRFVLCIR